MNDLLAAERSRRRLQIALGLITLATLPFYCFGIILLANPPARTTNPTPQPINTEFTLPTNTVPGFASVTPLPQNNPTLQPTPGQYIPPTVVRFITPTFVFPTLTPTTFIFPTATLAPSLTPFPTETPYPTLTNTTIPLPTFTETTIPLPTNTETPTSTPTETPTLEVLPP